MWKAPGFQSPLSANQGLERWYSTVCLARRPVLWGQGWDWLALRQKTTRVCETASLKLNFYLCVAALNSCLHRYVSNIYLVDQSINQLTDRPNDRSINQSINRSINQSINRPTDRLINQSISQFIIIFFLLICFILLFKQSTHGSQTVSNMHAHIATMQHASGSRATRVLSFLARRAGPAISSDINFPSNRCHFSCLF